MRYILLFLLAIIPLHVYAEGGCPPGYYPQVGQGVGGCIPIPGFEDTQPQYTGPIWEDRWGAIVNGRTLEGYSDFGAASGLKTERNARRAAMQNCRSKGLKQCELLATYRNQCAVWIAGDSYIMASTAETIEIAESEGLPVCDSKSSNCLIYYRNCSYPERIQ